MNRIRTIIVDDELEARNGLQSLLEEDPEIEIVDQCSNGIEAIELINTGSIDLAFLDIQMPVVDGFDVVRSVDPEKLPWFIFVTAYDEYSIKAFEVHAIDYILKPYTDSRLLGSLKRAKELIRQKEAREHFLKLPSEGGSDDIADDGKENRLVIKENGVVRFIDWNHIQWVEAFDYYIKVHTSDKFHLVRTSMKKIERSLPVQLFLRIHKSTIINRTQVAEISKGMETVKLKNGVERNVGRTYREKLTKLMS